MALPGSAPVVNPNGYTGGNGGGSNWSALSAGTFGTKREFQTNHSVTGSITKVRGRWNHKAGLEYRNLLSNYWDLEQASVAMPSPFAHSGGNFNFQYATASGGVASLVTTNAQRGVNAAAMLLGTGVWWIRPGANVQPALAQKYFAVYSQNDWRASSKLTINLGLRWEAPARPDRALQSHVGVGLRGRECVRHQGRDCVPGCRRLQPEPVGHHLRQLGASGRRGLLAQRPHRPSRRLRHHLSAQQHRLLLGADGLWLGQLLRGCDADGVWHHPARRAGDPVLRSGADRAGDRRRPHRAAGLRHRRGAVRPSLQERPGASVELLHRAVALQELDGVDRLHGVGEPEPVQSVVSDPEPAEHPRRYSSPSGATSTSPATAR